MDKKIYNALLKEQKRQRKNIELIASENFVSKDILKLQGSIFTNKYAEGYPNKRYYGGCINVDTVEELAISYAKEVFKCKYANVQPHSGSNANLAVYKALLQEKDIILGLDLSSGGHLTHGSKVNFSGKEYQVISYHVNKETELIDYKEVEQLAKQYHPKLIIAGASAYSREIDFARFRQIASLTGAYLMVDMAHIAGLVAAGLHQSPIPYADIVTTTTHKTLRGPRGGMILTNNEEIAKKIDKAVFPGIQGGPLMHVISAKAQCLYEAKTNEFKQYIKDVIRNAKALCNTLKEEGFRIVQGGTDNHLIVVDVKASLGITGKEAEEVLDKINITVNKNTIPYDTLPPTLTSGIRLGTPAMTTKGLKEKDFIKIGKIISEALKNKDDKKVLKKLKKEVKIITEMIKW